MITHFVRSQCLMAMGTVPDIQNCSFNFKHTHKHWMWLQLCWYNKVWNVTTSGDTNYLGNMMLSFHINYYALGSWSEWPCSLVIPCVHTSHTILLTAHQLRNFNPQLQKIIPTWNSRLGDKWLFLTKAWTSVSASLLCCKKQAILNAITAEVIACPAGWHIDSIKDDHLDMKTADVTQCNTKNGS